MSVPDEAATQSMVEAGVPEWFATNVATVFGRLRGGTAARATDTVERLTGDEPRRFDEFARDYAHAFAG